MRQRGTKTMARSRILRLYVTRRPRALFLQSVFVGIAAIVVLGSQTAASADARAADTVTAPEIARGEALYRQRCAVCHDQATGRTPPRLLLGFRSPRAVANALSRGPMRPMAEGLDTSDIAAVVAFLTGSAPGDEAIPTTNRCPHPGPPVAIGPDDWPQVGRDIAGSRYQAMSRIRAEDLARLELRWAFAYPDGASGPVQVAGGRVFLASRAGQIFSLDARSGCSHWVFETDREVRAVTIGPMRGTSDTMAVFFGDDHNWVTALDAATGALLWRTQVETHPLSRITSPPSLHEGRVFVPISGMEDPLTHDPDHPCCTHRGAVAALDASSGRLLWKSYTIEETPKLLPADPGAPQRTGPAGGSVFTPLGIDPRRGLVYAATAEAYGPENPAGSYAVVAFDAATGAHRWQRQFIPAQAERSTICSAVADTDCRNLFSMSTQVLVQPLPDGRDILLVGSKAGWVYGLDPDSRGKTVWERKVGQGGDLGGVMYGISADERFVYVPIADTSVQSPQRPGGLVALDAASGDLRWRAEPMAPRCRWLSDGEVAACANANSCTCSSANVAATTAIPGAVFSGSWDGHVRAHATADGRVLWDFDTGDSFGAVNGVQANGGQVGGYPVVVAEDLVFVTSGASSIGRPGNALLVFGIPDDHASIELRADQ
jgi:polyvinyl alcohol dehydrogenase (cytochrome)